MDVVAVRRVKVLDGLIFSFELLEYHHEQLYPACLRLHQDSTALVPAMAAAWGFVDALHRARELAQMVRGLGRRNPHLARFLRSTQSAEDYRHYIQHLRSELAETKQHTFAVWGSLSWVDSKDDTASHTVIIGSMPPDAPTSFSGATYDTQARNWVSRVSLGIRDLSFDFDPMLDAIRAFRAFVVPWIIEQGGLRLEPVSSLQIVTIRVPSTGPPN